MTTFLEDEVSIEASAPREGIEFILPSETFRVATGVRDEMFGDDLYEASPGRRDEVGISMSSDPRAMVVTLPMIHPLCRRYMVSGVPPRQIFVNVWRKQSVSGVVEKVWCGYATSLAPEGNVGKINVPSQLGETGLRRLPTISAGKACPHVLYDDNCRVVRGDFKVTTNVTTFNGRTINVDVAPGTMDNDWATWGELVHVDSGERMTIQSQTTVVDITGTHLVIIIQAPIVELGAGDAIDIYAGCAHTIEVCDSKFSNPQNYGGFPLMPSYNPFEYHAGRSI